MASSGPYDVHEGLVGDTKVSVKRLRMYLHDEQGGHKRVRVRFRRSSPPTLMKFIGFLRGSSRVEALGPPKHCSPFGCHIFSLSAYLTLDGGWRTLGIHWCESKCKPGWSRESRQRNGGTRALIWRQLSDIAVGLNFLHCRGIVHGDLKGVRETVICSPTLLTRILAEYSRG